MKPYSLLCAVCAVLFAGAVDAVPPGTAEEIRERLAPFGQVCREGESCGGLVAGSPASGGGSTGMSGKEIYDQFCFACHATGVSEAPLFGDLEQWQSRIDKGMEAMLATSLEGLNLMPPMGSCMSCTDEEMRATIQYMVDSAE